MLALPRDAKAEITVDTTKAAKPKNRNAVDAWASWQRFPLLAEPLVMKLLSV